MGQIPIKLDGALHGIKLKCIFLNLFPHDAWWVPIRYPLGIMRKKKSKKCLLGLYFLKCPLAFYDLEGILWMH